MSERIAGVGVGDVINLNDLEVLFRNIFDEENGTIRLALGSAGIVDGGIGGIVNKNSISDIIRAMFDTSSNALRATIVSGTIEGRLFYQGTWNANTNTPTLTDGGGGTSSEGYYYVVSVAGSTSLDGITDWKIGDWVISNGIIWQKIDNTDQVSSVFGRQGVIVAQAGDYTKADVGLGNVPNLDTTTAISQTHIQGTDLGLDTGGINAVTAAQAKAASGHQIAEDTIIGIVKCNGVGVYSDADSDDVPMDIIGTPTYESLKDWFDTIQSAAGILGGAITDGGSGTANVALGSGIVKKTDSATGENVFFDWGNATGVALTDNSINYIYVDYNGGTPIVAANVDISAITLTTQIVLGRVYREGTTLHILEAGAFFQDYMMRSCFKSFESEGFKHVSGAALTGKGTRNIDITAGVFYCALNRILTNAFDSSVADTFSYWYNDGAWQEDTLETQINNLEYNDFGTGTVTLTANRYAVAWVYLAHDSDVDVVMGQGDYTLAQANIALAPSSLPGRLNGFSTLVGKIIVQKSSDTMVVTSAFDTKLESGAVDNHNDLGQIQGGIADQRYHSTQDYHDQHSQLPGLVEIPKSFDSTGINAAIDALGSDGGTVQLLPGHYNITAQIEVDVSKTKIVGNGASTILWGSNRAVFDNATGTLAVGNTITGSVNSYTAIVRRIVYDTATTGTVWFTDLSNSAGYNDDEVLASGGNNITINGASIQPTYSVIQSAGGKDETVLQDFVIWGASGSGVSNSHGITFAISANSRIQNVVINRTSGNGIVSLATTGLQAINCKVDHCEGNGISFGSGADMFIRGNSVIGSGAVNILVSGAQHLRIVGNFIDGDSTSTKGLALTNSDNCIITGNHLLDHTTVGIEELANCDDNIIKDNDTEGESNPYDLNGLTPTYTRAISFFLDGNAYVAENIQYILPSFPGHIVKVWVYAITGPTGSALTVDVNKNGVTIFSTQANRPSIPAGSTFDVSGQPNTPDYNGSDRISFSVDAVGSSTTGAKLMVTLLIV